MDTAQNIANADPSGFLPAALAAVKLVGAVAKVAPHVKHAVDSARSNSTNTGTNTGIAQLNRSVSHTDTAAPASLQVDPEREARAYETVNYVLRTLGNQLGESGLVSAPALTKALTAASTHIEVELFSVNANRLFKSLSSKLGDAVLVNSVFTSIYFLGAVTAELRSSLPNYKASYSPLGPSLYSRYSGPPLAKTHSGRTQQPIWMLTRRLQQQPAYCVQLILDTQYFQVTANRGATVLAILMRVAGFPSLSPTRYSSKSYTEVRNHRNIFERLIKHFDLHGFPQPRPGKDVGPIKDWRFLSGDANSRYYEVEKADRHIGEAIGRVLYWLICGADRMQPGMAVIAYYKQHIELIQWMGSRFGYEVLSGATDLDLGGPHLKLENKYRATIEAWAIIVPSEEAQAHRKQSKAQWNQQLPDPPVSPQSSSASTSHGRPSISSSISSVENFVHLPTKVSVNTSGQSAAPRGAIGIGSAIAHAGAAARRSESYPKPSGHMATAHSTSSSPATPATIETPTQPPSMSSPAGSATPGAQSTSSTPATPNLAELSVPASSPSRTPVAVGNTFAQQNSPSKVSPPLYSPSYFPPVSAAPIDASQPSQPLPNKLTESVVRRKAPPPPRKVYARALYDFAPEEEGGEELVFHEGDELEIVKQSKDLEADGWCKAKVKGTAKVGLAPLEYIEMINTAPLKPQSPPIELAQPHPVSSSVPHVVSGGQLNGSRSLSGAGISGAAQLSRNISPPSASTGRPHSGMQPRLMGIHENPHPSPNPDIHQNTYIHVNPNGRPHSIAIQNPRVRPHSNSSPLQQIHQITNNPQPQSHHPNVSTQQPAATYPRPHSQLSLGSQQSRINNQSLNGPGATHQFQSATGQSNASNMVDPSTQQPAGLQQSSYMNSTRSSNLAPNMHRASAASARPGPAFNIAPNLSLILGGTGLPHHSGQQQTHHNNHNTNSSNNSTYMNSGAGTGNSQNYGDSTIGSNAGYQNYPATSTASNAGTYYNNSNYNPNMQNSAYYAPPDNSNYANSGMGQGQFVTAPTFSYDPKAGMYSNSGGYYSNSGGYSSEDLGLSAGAGAVAGVGLDSLAGDGVDPASFLSSSSDLASLDPFYAMNNPGAISAGPGTPTSLSAEVFTEDVTTNTDSATGDVTSPLAGLALGGSTTSLGSTDPTAATDALGSGSNLVESSLAGLAPNNGSVTDLGGLSSDLGTMDMTSPLAGLAPNNGSTTDLGGFGDPNADGTNLSDSGGQTMTEEQTQTTYMEEDTTSNGDQSSIFIQQDDTTTYTDMGDGSDDGFGYS